MNLTEQITRLRGLNEKRNRGVDWVQYPSYLNEDGHEMHWVAMDMGVGTSEVCTTEYAGNAAFIAAAPEMLSIIETQHALLVMAKEALRASDSVDWALEEIKCNRRHHIGGLGCTHCLLQMDKEERVAALAHLTQAGLE